jgi:hypothetical protein
VAQPYHSQPFFDQLLDFKPGQLVGYFLPAQLQTYGGDFKVLMGGVFASIHRKVHVNMSLLHLCFALVCLVRVRIDSRVWGSKKAQAQAISL